MNAGEFHIAEKKGRIQLRVRYADTDRMGVVYNGKYFEYLEVGRNEFMRGLGLAYSKIESEGVGLVVVDAKIKFRASATYDDIICVECWIKNLSRSSVTFGYNIYKDELLLVEAETTLVTVDIEKYKAIKLPENLDKILRENLIEQK